MASQSFGQTLACVDAAGTLYNTFTTAKSMLTSATATAASAGFIKLPAGFFQEGTSLVIDFMAGVSWASGNTVTFQVMLNAVIAFTSGAIKVTTTGGTTEPWVGHIELTCRTKGNGTLATLIGSGTLAGRGVCPIGATAGANYTAGMGFAMMQEAVPAAGTGFDSTIDNTLDFFVGMGASSASNGFQLQQYRVFSPNVAGF